MNRWWRWWLAGLIAYLAFLLATFPASYAIAWLQKRLPDVQLTGVNGSIWSGAAQEFGVSGRPWGELRWRFDWRTPFTGHLGYSLQLQDTGLAIQGRVAIARAGKLLLQDLQGHLAVARLDPWLPLPTGSVSGTLDVQITRLVLVDARPTVAEGSLSLTDTSLNWPEPVTLGSYQLKLQTPANDGIQGSLLDTGGPLILQGTLRLTPDGHYQVNGTLTSRDSTDTAVNNLLHSLPTDAAGNHPFQFDGQW